MNRNLALSAVIVISGCVNSMEEYQKSIIGETSVITVTSPNFKEYKGIPLLQYKTINTYFEEFNGCTNGKENSGKKMLGRVEITQNNYETTFNIPANKELAITTSATENFGGTHVSCTTSIKFKSESHKKYKYVFESDNSNIHRCRSEIYEQVDGQYLELKSAYKARLRNNGTLVPRSLSLCEN